MSNNTVKMKIFRFDPAVDSEPHYDIFEVETQTGYSIYNALEFVAENLDPTLAYYASCRIGLCAGCMAKVNGKVVKTCLEMLTEDVTIDPVDEKKVLKDLVMVSADTPEEIC